jgi:hypothetical protein
MHTDFFIQKQHTPLCVQEALTLTALCHLKGMFLLTWCVALTDLSYMTNATSFLYFLFILLIFMSTQKYKDGSTSSSYTRKRYFYCTVLSTPGLPPKYHQSGTATSSKVLSVPRVRSTPFSKRVVLLPFHVKIQVAFVRMFKFRCSSILKPTVGVLLPLKWYWMRAFSVPCSTTITTKCPIEPLFC